MRGKNKVGGRILTIQRRGNFCIESHPNDHRKDLGQSNWVVHSPTQISESLEQPLNNESKEKEF